MSSVKDLGAGMLASLRPGLIALLLCVWAPGPLSALPPVGYIDSLVGSGVGDGQPAAQAIIDPRGLSARTAGGITTLYIADGANNRVRMVSGAGIITTIAGSGRAGYSGDGGTATQADLRFPTDVAVDGSGNVYVSDTDNNRVRRIANGIITTYAGNGTAGGAGDGGPATNANLWAPRGLAFDGAGNLYIAEFSGNRIRKVAPNGTISRVAGNGNWGSSGDGALATAASLANPSGVAIDAQGNLFIADYNNSKIRRVDTQGIITTICGDGYQGFVGDGGPASAARLKLPYRITFDPSGNLLIADNGNNRARQIQAVGGLVSGAGTITTLAGNGSNGSSGDGGPATNASLWYLNGLAVDGTNKIYLGVTLNQLPSTENRVRTVASGTIQTYVGGGVGDGGPALEALIDPRGSDSGGAAAPNNIYIADANNNRVRFVDGNSGVITTIAGNGTAGFSGDGNRATSATLHSPFDVSHDGLGNLWIADTLNNRVRRVNPSGIITTVAGTGSYGYTGEGNATSSALAYPYGIAADSTGSTVYIADFGNNRVRKVSSGVISTVAGNGGFGYAGDGGLAVNAKLASPSDVALGPDGTLYIADYSNHVVRHVRSDGIIERVAGSGIAGFSGDNGLATDAKLNLPNTISFDSAGNLYIGDSQNKRIRRVDTDTGIITTIAGTGTGGTEGDDGLAIAANLYRATGLGISPNGALYISQSDSSRVRVVTLDTGSTPSTLALSGTLRYVNSNAVIDGASVTFTSPTQGTRSTTSDANGAYSGSLSKDSWTVTPRKVDDVLSAITAIDASVVLEASVGLRNLTGLQELASDANGSGSITAIDASLILQYRVGILTTLPVAQACGSDWIFAPTPATVPNQALIQPDLVSGSCRLGAISYNPLTASASQQDFTGVLFGDANVSWSGGGGGAAAAAQGTVHIGRLRRQGGAVWVPLVVSGTANFSSAEITLRYDARVLSSPSVRRTTALDGALVETNPSVPGRVAIALASATPLPAGRIFWIRFASTNHVSRGALSIVHAQVESE